MNKPTRKKETAVDEVRTEGQRRLRALQLTGAELAEQLVCTRQAISLWRSGEKRPGKATQIRLEELHQIPVASWHEPPQDVTPTPSPPTSTAPNAPNAPTPPPRDELREVELLIDEVRAIRASGKLMPRDRDQNIRTETDLLERRSKIEERVERARVLDQKLEHQVVTTVLEVLKRFPNVEAEVLAALRALKRANA